MADLYQQAARFRGDLLAGERRAASELVKAYGAAYTRITGELEQVTAEVAKRRAAGVLDKDIPALLYRQGRLQVLQEKVRDEVGRFAGKADIIVGGAIGEAATKGQEHAAKLVDIALPEGVSVTPSGRRRPDGTLDITSLAPQEIGLATGAAEQATAVTRASAPVGRLFAELGPQGAKAATDALISGVVAGKNPKVIARDMRGALGGNLTRALTIARTETLRAYREASRGVYQDNAQVLRGWIWIADIGPRTCPSCFAQHGSVHDLSEVMATHPRCRCTMAPATKPWRELGFGDTPEAVQIEDGPTAFRRLSAADQRRVLGPAKYEAYTRREITLPDLVAKRESPIWGPSTQEASLRAAKNNAALRRAGGGEPPRTTPELPAPAAPDDFRAELEAIRREVGEFGVRDADLPDRFDDPQAFQQAFDAATNKQVDAVIRGGDAILREVDTRLGPVSDELVNGQQRLKQLGDDARAAYAEYERLKAARAGADALNDVASRYNALLEEQDTLARTLTGHADARRKALAEVLGEVREMGLAPGEQLPLGKGAGGAGAKAMREVTDLLPRDWLTRMRAWAARYSDDGLITVRKGSRGFFRTDGTLIVSEGRAASSLSRGASTALHEMTHWAEYSVPVMRQLESAYYARRTTVAGVQEPLKRMRDLRPGRGYTRDEVTREDKWATPYMGKDYGPPSSYDRTGAQVWEIMTMGIERAFATDPMWYIEIDPEHLRFVLGILALI